MQVPAPIAYERATSLSNAIELLSRHGPESRIIAGGHSLLPMMKLRLARPEVVIDINDLAELDYIRANSDHLQIGAMVRHASLMNSDITNRYFPIFREAETVIADPIVRNRGTVGGSLCQADPAEDLAAVFAALKASVVITGNNGSRTVPISSFHIGPYMTVVEPDELLTEVIVPLRTHVGSAYEKVERRAGDWGIASVGAMIVLNSGQISEAGIGLAAVRADHFRAVEAESFLLGKQPTADVIAQAALIASENCQPVADQRGPEDYKRHLVKELTTRALNRAIDKAREEGT